MHNMSERDKKKLLQPGWGGDLSKEELAYIKDKLMRDKRLRAKWGFKKGTGRLSEAKIRLVALYGVDALENIPNFESEASVQLRTHFLPRSGGRIRVLRSIAKMH